MKTDLFIIESPSKIDIYKNLILKSGITDFSLISTKGRLRDIISNDISISKEYKINSYKPISSGRYSFIEKCIKDSKRVFSLTDSDPEGELISFEIKNICSENNIPHKRLHLKSFDIESFSKCLKDDEGVNQKVVESCLARRVVDRLIGFKTPKHIKSGRVYSPALNLIQKNNHKEIKSFVKQSGWCSPSTHVLTEKSLPKEKIRKISQNKKSMEYPDGREIIQKISTHFGWSVERSQKAIQDTYENGKITYPRTLCRSIDKGFKDRIVNESRKSQIDLREPSSKDDVGAHRGVYPLDMIDLDVSASTMSDEGCVLYYLWEYLRRYHNNNIEVYEEKGVDENNRIYTRDLIIEPNGRKYTACSLDAPLQEDGVFVLDRANYVLSILIDSGLGTPSTICSHAMKISRDALNEDYSLSERGLYYSDKTSKDYPLLQDLKTIKLLEDIIEKTGGSYYTKVAESLMKTGLDEVLGLSSEEDKATRLRLSELGLD